LGVRLTTLLCIKIIVAKSKNVRSEWSDSRHTGETRQIWQKFQRKAMAQKVLFDNYNDGDDDEEDG
jgi:hypothetical protein